MSKGIKHKTEFAALSFQVFLVLSAMYLTICRKTLDQELISFFLYYENPVLLCKEHAGTFLSVNATIFMIYAALWALLSNLSDKEFAGIHYNEYFLNMKPCIYKQKNVFLFSLLILFISCVCYPCGLYTIVEAMLFCEITCIAVSGIFIYNVFIRDKAVINEEIREFSLNGQTSR